METELAQCQARGLVKVCVHKGGAHTCESPARNSSTSKSKLDRLTFSTAGASANKSGFITACAWGLAGRGPSLPGRGGCGRLLTVTAAGASAAAGSTPEAGALAGPSPSLAGGRAGDRLEMLAGLCCADD